MLEQALLAFVVPHIQAKDMYLYVFSDTVILAAPDLSSLLDLSSRLFLQFMSTLSLQRAEELSDLILLRGAISHGNVAESTVLVPSDRVSSVPLLDRSLATAYELEGVRKGSRIFLDPKMSIDRLSTSLKTCIINWQSIPGRGRPQSSVHEFLWPALVYLQDAQGLARLTIETNKVWLRFLRSRDWSIPEYDKVLLDFDETLKLCIRSCSVISDSASWVEALMSLLPANSSSVTDVRFEWGVWFQIMKALQEGIAHDSEFALEVAAAIRRTIAILKQVNFWDTFLIELKMPDYESFRRRLIQDFKGEIGWV
ncbi:MAG: hypothetical protein ACC700_16720 [Anaerolineales bacterium]